jgi:ClpX C4-type zinc finger/Glyoxalase superfamily protein
MRDFRDAKTMAKALRRGLSGHGLSITHSQSLELIALAFGYDNWNILAAKIDPAKVAPTATKRPVDGALRCAFCGKSEHDVNLLIAGPGTSICNECVALCDDVVEDEEVLRRLRDRSADVDSEAALEAYLTERTPEELAAYLARAQKHIADEQLLVDGLDGDEANLPMYLKNKEAPDRAKARARLAWRAALWSKSVEIVARLLAARS